MEVKINETQYNAVLKAVTQISILYEHGISAFNEILKNSLKDYKDEIDFSDIEINFVKNDSFTRNLAAVTNKQWNDVDIPVLERTLDLFIRIALGQWNELAYLSNAFYLDDGVLKQLSKKRCLIKNFQKLPKSITSASLGIGSEEINDDIVVIYDFYKVLMFEDGAGGCYSHTPLAFSKEPLPEILISSRFVDPETFNEFVKESENNGKPIICDIDGAWLPINDHTSRLYQPDKYDFFKKKNGYFYYKERPQS